MRTKSVHQQKFDTIISDVNSNVKENSDCDSLVGCDSGTRIAKFIASAGYCSRREAERFVLEGRVRLNGKIVEKCATFVSINDQIEIDSKMLNLRQKRTRLWAYYKPLGIITTHFDPQGRRTAISEIQRKVGDTHLITIGMLDINSEGLLLVTNDGNLANEFMLPKNAYLRKYKVRAFGQYDKREMSQIAKIGLNIDGIRYRPFEIRVLKEGFNSWFEVTIFEGKNREIRKIFEYFGLRVSRLIRIQYGEYTLGSMYEGEIQEIF